MFVVLPTALYRAKLRVPALPLLWVLTAYCLGSLWRDGRLGLLRLDTTGLRERLPAILALFVPFAVLTTALVARFAPTQLFGLARTRPALWALVLLLYPLLSVYPQAIIYRAFFFERYRALFPGDTLLILMSALAFAYVHIVFRNWIALALTTFGGLLFAVRHAQTGSLFLSAFEHTLYGCWIFTVGLGRWFFYQGQWRSR